MYNVLVEACRVHGGFAGYSNGVLQETLNDIVNQQDRVPVATREE
jgi:hypothetical protein